MKIWENIRENVKNMGENMRGNIKNMEEYERKY